MDWDSVMTGLRSRTANRRKLTLALAFVIALTSAVVPMPAQAFFPALAVSLVSRAGSVVATGWARTAAVHLIGGTAMAAIFNLTGDTSVRIPLTSDSSGTDSAMPAPSAPGTSDPVQSSVWMVNGSPYSDLGSACAAAVAFQTSINPPPTGYGNSAVVLGGACYLRQTNQTGGWGDGTYTDYPQSVGNPVVTNTCPPGYALSGSSCILSSPRGAVPDGNYDLVNTGSGYATQPEADSQPDNVSIQNGKAIIWGTNADGEPFVTEITSTSSGTTVKSSTQTANGVQQTTYTLNGAGVITQAESGSYAGSIDASGAIPGVNTGAPATPVNINIPGDYARAGEAGQAAASIINALDAPSISDIARPGANKDIPDFETGKKTIENLPAPDFDIFSLVPHIFPGEAVVCVPIPFEGTISAGPAAGLSATSELDMCWMFEIVRNILGWLFGVVTLLYVWRTLTGSQSWEK